MQSGETFTPLRGKALLSADAVLTISVGLARIDP